MDEEAKSKYNAKAERVRVELKQWESEWARTHDGYKPGRQDIKNNPDIAAKYKEYNKIRDILSGKIPLASKHQSVKPPKRKPAAAPVETPVKRTKHAETPSKEQAPAEDLMNTPAISRKLFSPAAVTTLGPTPQRDGRVLGLFDLLVEKELGTPSKKEQTMKEATQGRVNVLATPSKRSTSLDAESDTKLGRTPMSSTKRQLLNTFMTPLKNKSGRDGEQTPQSVSKLQFDTPAFLKRHSLPSLDENTEFDAPAPLRLPRKPLTRGLSEIVASLRKVEEDHLDDELDALREAEGEVGGSSKPTPLQRLSSDIVKDSQTVRPLLNGMDDEGMYDSPDEDLSRGGVPMRVYKKKGQKRTTRKVNMKPTRSKRPAEMARDESGDEDADAIPETQAGIGNRSAAGLDPDADFLDAESDCDLHNDGLRNKSKDKSKSQKVPYKQVGADQKTSGKEGTVKKTARKVNELAHANFHRLKLRNHGAKGGPAHNSKFRRRR